GTGGGWREGHGSAGTTRAGTKWALGEGQSEPVRNVKTYVLIANTSAWTGQARVSVLLEDGTEIVKMYQVLANSRSTLDIGLEFPEAADSRYGVTVESIGPHPAEIVVERAMYSDAV